MIGGYAKRKRVTKGYGKRKTYKKPNYRKKHHKKTLKKLHCNPSNKTDLDWAILT